MLGFSYDWDREVNTTDPKYYKWTQWIFANLFDSYYCQRQDKAMPISHLVNYFSEQGNVDLNTSCDADTPLFTSGEWSNFSKQQKEDILQKYRLAFLSDTWVNWCQELGTVLANDEVKDGVSERGGFPVEQRLMKQWSLRITAFAERLLSGLETIQWSDSIKEIQRNWIGKSEGVSLIFKTDNFIKYVSFLGILKFFKT